MTYIVRFNSEDQGSHGTLCFYLIDIIYIFILKCRIPLRTLIFMSYDSQGISIIDPVTFSWAIIAWVTDLYIPNFDMITAQFQN